MATYFVELPNMTPERADGFADYLRETVAGQGIKPRAISRDGEVMWLSFDVREYLAGLPFDCDGHIDRDGVMWWDGAGYPVALVVGP